MDKPAPTDHPILDVIRDRWSPVAFDPTPLEPETVRTLLEAARWAPSSFNEQPWMYFAGLRHEDPEHWHGIYECLVPGNQSWAQHAPLLMLSVASESFSRNGKPNRHAWHDVGMASAQLTLQATAMGLVVHHMAGFDADAATLTFGIPEGYEPVATMAIGRPGDGSLLDDAARQRDAAPRTRKPLGEIVSGGAWEDPPNWL